MAYIHECNEKKGLITVSDDNGDTFVIFMYEDMVKCPCGDMIELDGECPEGHVSPAFDIL